VEYGSEDTRRTKFRAFIEPVALYEHRISKLKQKWDVFDSECLRSIMGIKWHRGNEETTRTKADE
jgi:hypothetical protein